jgi:hypothetical protein
MGSQITKTARWDDYHGKAIISIDFADLKGQDLADEIEANRVAFLDLAKSGHSEFLFVTDVSRCLVTDKALEAFKRNTKDVRPYTKGSAVVGITGLRKFALDLVNKFSGLNTKAFDTHETAKEWLIKL